MMGEIELKSEGAREGQKDRNGQTYQEDMVGGRGREGGRERGRMMMRENKEE